jgi:hypothetical protein
VEIKNMNRFDIALGKTPPPAKPEKPGLKVDLEKYKIMVNPFVAQAMDLLSGSSVEALSPLVNSEDHGQTSTTSLIDFESAASMANPLRQRLDQGSLARRMLMVDPLQPRALPIYDNSDNAYTIDAEQNVRHQNSPRTTVPIFEVSATPSIPLSRMRNRRFSLIERAQDLAYNTIRTREGILAFRLLNEVINVNDRNINITEFNPDSIADAFSGIEQSDSRVNNIFMNVEEYSVMRRWGRQILDLTTNREQLSNGILGSIWGAQINVSRIIPEGSIYVMAEPQFVGVMPIRQDITVLSADDPVNREIGWFVSEQIGMACTNSRGIVRMNLPGSSHDTTRIRSYVVGVDLSRSNNNLTQEDL